jgi:hypothetical protein
MKAATRILTAPLRGIGLAAAWLFEVLASINPLVLAVYLLSDE